MFPEDLGLVKWSIIFEEAREWGREINNYKIYFVFSLCSKGINLFYNVSKSQPLENETLRKIADFVVKI